MPTYLTDNQRIRVLCYLRSRGCMCIPQITPTGWIANTPFPDYRVRHYAGCPLWRPGR